MSPTIASRERHATMSGVANNDELVDEFSVFGLASKTCPAASTANTTTQSLRGFDPMLEICESRDDQWPDTAIDLDLTLASSSESTQDVQDSYQVPKRASSTEVRELRDIAAEIGRAMPKALTKEEENEITLGTSIKASGVKGERNLLQVASNLRRASAPLTPIRKKKDRSTRPTTPSPKERRKSLRRSISAKLSPLSKSKRSSTSTLTRSLEREQFSSPNSIPSKMSPLRRRHGASITGTSELAIPSLAKPNPNSFLHDSTTMALKTSEHDPSPHQVAIPSSQEVFAHSKLCALLDSYGKVDDNFNLNVFKGVNLQVLNKAASDDSQPSIPGMTPIHKIMMKQLLKCSKDIMVEGFFTRGEGKEQSRVGIFSMQSNGRMIVVFRGTTEQQARPARAKSFAVDLDPKHSVSVYAPIRDAYFQLEKSVYKHLDKLMEENPFNHVTFVGHSFGGALATLGAVRFANARPMQCFFCHAFGSPKVGTHDFRTMAHSLPNLNIVRVEYGSDPNVTGTYPADVGPLKWSHVGHTIAIRGSVGGSGSTSGTSSITTRTNSSSSKQQKQHQQHASSSMAVLAYRFDRNKPSSSSMLINTIRGTTTTKSNGSIQDYVRALKPFALEHVPWAMLYVGEEGRGVRGRDNETRSVV